MDPLSRLMRFGFLYAVLFGTIAVIYPFIPIYFSLRGFSPSQIGLLLASLEISGIIAPFIISGLADRSGRFRTLIGVLLILAFISFAILNTITSFGGVLVMSLALGLFLKPVIGLVDALTGRGLVNSSLNYGRVRVWGTLSFILVSLTLQITGLLDTGGARRIYLAIASAMILQLLAVPMAPAVPPRPKTAGSGAIGTDDVLPGNFRSFLAVCFIGNIGFSVYQAFGSLYFSGIASLSGVSGLIALSAISEIPVMLFGGRLLKRFGHRNMLATAFSAGILRLFVLAVFPQFVPIAVSQFMHAFTYGFFLLAGVDWVNRRVPQGQRARGMGLFMAASFSGSLLAASSLGGYLLEHRGFNSLFGWAIVFPVIALAWLLSDRRFREWGLLDEKV